jgi:hypothetical protein
LANDIVEGDVDIEPIHFRTRIRSFASRGAESSGGHGVQM